MSGSRWTAERLPPLEGRTVVITGATSGLGRGAARELARAGARVVLAVRDTARGGQVAREIGSEVDVRELDLADLESVREFASAWDGDIDVLLNNAGVMATPPRRTADGFELHIGTNHLGHFALTCLLIDRVTDRVVTVSAALHKLGKVDLDDLNWERRRYRRWAAYCQSKLANMLFMLELQRRLNEAGSDVRSLAAHPGYTSTGLQSHTGSRLQNGMMGVSNRLVAMDEEQGILPLLYAAIEDLASGTFAGPDGPGELSGYPRPVGRSKRALDEEKARGLWELSERLTGTTLGEPVRG